MTCGLVKIQTSDNQSLVLSCLLMRVPCCYSFIFFNAKKGPADKNARKSGFFYKILAEGTVSLRGDKPLQSVAINAITSEMDWRKSTPAAGSLRS